MKALISPNESFTYTWVTSWEWIQPSTQPGYWKPLTTNNIENCVRVAEVMFTPFDVAQPLFWIDCPDDCEADIWYYKDGQVQPKPQNAPYPLENV